MILKTNKFSKVVVDMNNYFHRHYHRLKSKVNDKEIYKETGKSTFNGLVSLEKNYGGSFCKVYCLFDNHDSKINLRSDLSEDYKKNRQSMPSKFYETLEQVKSMILSYKDNYKVVYIDYLEADDLVLPLVESFNEHESVLLVSEDHDWARMINYQDRNIQWLTSKNGIIEKEKYKELFGFYPTLQSVILYKTIRGDKSDGIPPSVPNIQEKVVLEICKNFYDAYDLIQNAHKVSFISDHFKDLIKRESANIIRSHKLVSFIALPDLKDNIKNHIYESSFKEQPLKMFYKIFGIDFSLDKRIQLKSDNSLFKMDTLPRR